MKRIKKKQHQTKKSTTKQTVKQSYKRNKYERQQHTTATESDFFRHVSYTLYLSQIPQKNPILLQLVCDITIEQPD